MAQQPSLIAHLLRAQISARMAMQTTDPAFAEMAIQDVTAAKTILRGNVLALVESVRVHQVAAILYGDCGQAEKHDQAQQVARADAAALAQFPDVPLAVERCGDFFEDDGQEELALHLYEKGMQRKAVGLLVAKNYAMLLYNRGEVERAAEVIKDHVPQGFLRNIALSWFVAELPCGPSRVRELCNQMPEKPADFRVAWQCIFLCYLGQKEMVPNVLRTFRSNSDRVPGRQAPGFDVLLDFLKEPGTEAEKKILQGVRHSKSGLTFWHFNIGVVRLGEGDRASARVHFEASIRAHDPYAPSYKVGRAFLVRMKKDPAWPRWIPMKNDKAKP